MTLGQRIARHRKVLGISQEELGGRLGVSRQAVSKWETDVATPDMNNLIALAREFDVSVAELTDTAEPIAQQPTVQASEPVSENPPSTSKQWRMWPILCVIFVIVLAVALLGGFLNSRRATSAAVQPPLPETEFLLYWRTYTGGGSNPREYLREYLTLGAQDTLFPFGTSLALTAPEEVTDTDTSGTTHHKAVCDGITVEYDHTEDEDGIRDVVTALSTSTMLNYATPRGIITGESEDDLLLEYGDDLVYCFKEEDGYAMVPHDDYYVYSAYEDDLGWGAILFYIKDGVVVGIRLELTGDAGDIYAPNNVTRFTLKDGKPDYTLHPEPEQEAIDDTQQVYIAWNELVTNDNLSAEEIYTYHWTVFSTLSELDWQEFGRLGTTERPEETIEALFSWLLEQAPYSEADIFRLQMGCTANGLDGAYAEMYCSLLSTAFFEDPIAFVRGLSCDGVSGTMYQAIRFTAYDAALHPAELQTALDTLNAAIGSGEFTEEELDWAKLLRLYLIAPIDSQNELPNTPAE